MAELRCNLRCQRTERTAYSRHARQPSNRNETDRPKTKTSLAFALPAIESFPCVGTDKSRERRGRVGSDGTDERSGCGRCGGFGSGWGESGRGSKRGEDDMMREGNERGGGIYEIVELVEGGTTNHRSVLRHKTSNVDGELKCNILLSWRVRSSGSSLRDGL